MYAAIYLEGEYDSFDPYLLGVYPTEEEAKTAVDLYLLLNEVYGLIYINDMVAKTTKYYAGHYPK